MGKRLKRFIICLREGPKRTEETIPKLRLRKAVLGMFRAAR